MLKWKLANRFDELRRPFLPDAMKVEALVVIAEQLAGINEQLEKLNEQVRKGIKVNVHPY